MSTTIGLRLKKILLIPFVFSLPYEYWDPFNMREVFTISKLIGFLYAALSILYLKESFNIKVVWPKVKLLILLWLWMLLISLFNYTTLNKVSPFSFSFFQIIIFYWVVSSDLHNKNIKLITILITYILSITLMYFLFIFGIGLEQTFIEGSSRLSIFGNNPNSIGALVSIAFLFSSYLLFSRKFDLGYFYYLIIFTLPIFLHLLLLTGSRGSLITVILGFTLLGLFNTISFKKKLVQFFFLVIASTYFYSQYQEIEVMTSRVNQSINEEFSLGGREAIWSKSISLFFDRPFTGYGVTGYESEILLHFTTYRDTHNIFLYILVTTGIIGFVLFMWFLYYHYKAVISSYRNKDILKLILFLAYLLIVFKSGGVITNKVTWLLLAIILFGNIKKESKLN